MRKFTIFFTVVIMTLFTLNVPSSAAYGWGYKKNQENIIPDVGIYKEIIDKYDAFYVDESANKELYITFDNGYEEGYTEKVLDVLKEMKVPATFFVTGHYVRSAPDLVKRMVKEGHIIGNHSDGHPDFTTLSKHAMKEELEKLSSAVSQITNQNEMIYVRPPRGTFNEETLQWASEFGYIHVFWSLAFKDWETGKQRGWQYAYNEIMNQIHPGAIILLHTVSEDNANALKKVIIQLQKDGYEFKSLDNLLWKELLTEQLVF